MPWTLAYAQGFQAWNQGKQRRANPYRHEVDCWGSESRENWDWQAGYEEAERVAEPREIWTHLQPYSLTMESM